MGFSSVVQKGRDYVPQGASLAQTGEARWHQGYKAGGLQISFTSGLQGCHYLPMALLPESASCIHMSVVLGKFSEVLRTSASLQQEENLVAHLTSRPEVT